MGCGGARWSHSQPVHPENHVSLVHLSSAHPTVSTPLTEPADAGCPVGVPGTRSPPRVTPRLAWGACTCMCPLAWKSRLHELFPCVRRRASVSAATALVLLVTLWAPPDPRDRFLPGPSARWPWAWGAGEGALAAPPRGPPQPRLCPEPRPAPEPEAECSLLRQSKRAGPGPCALMAAFPSTFLLSTYLPTYLRGAQGSLAPPHSGPG